MITNIELKDNNIIPISRTTRTNIDVNVPRKVIYKIYKPGDLIIGDLENKSIVISNYNICEDVNRDDIEDKKIAKVRVKKKYKKY